MAKYNVTYKCNHEGTVELFGKSVDRERKLEWLKSTLCPECYAREQAGQCEEIEMTYREYKNNYAGCKTLPNSYNKETKTIIVLVPVEEVEVETVETPAEAEEVLTVEEIAKKANSTVAKTMEMIAKSNEELDALIADLEKRVGAIEKPTRKQLEMLEGAKMSIDLVKRYKAQN